MSVNVPQIYQSISVLVISCIMLTDSTALMGFLLIGMMVVFAFCVNIGTCRVGGRLVLDVRTAAVGDGGGAVGVEVDEDVDEVEVTLVVVGMGRLVGRGGVTRIGGSVEVVGLMVGSEEGSTVG